MDKKYWKFYVVYLIIIAIVISGFTYIGRVLPHDGDWRCAIAECRINKE